MTKLSQIVAVEKGVKSRATRDVTNAHRATHTPEPLNGLTRSYTPRDDEGERLPGESKRVQYTVEDVNDQVATALGRLFDVTLTKDVANTFAKANVSVDGYDILEDVPVTYLLFLEKQLSDLRTYVEQLPTLDPSEEWVADDQPSVWRTQPVQTTRTRKVPRNHVRAEATKEHPAQVDVFTEDVVIGDWTTIRRSGHVSEARRAELVERVDALQRAVKYAREEANSMDITDMSGAVLLEYIFA